MAFEAVLIIELEVGSHGAITVKKSRFISNRNIDYFDKLEEILKELKEEVKTT